METMGDQMRSLDGTQKVYVLGADYQVHNLISWDSACTNLLLGKATSFLAHPTARVRSADGAVDFPRPLIIRDVTWKYSRPTKTVGMNDHASNSAILMRDSHTCAYCGGVARTVDHVVPKSRATAAGIPFRGQTWGNLVAACFACNNAKGDRTPEEAGMRLRFTPHTGATTPYAGVQALVWEILASGGGVDEETSLYEGYLAGDRSAA